MIASGVERFAGRPVGVSSRLRPAPGPRHTWITGEGVQVPLPVTLDIVLTSLAGEVEWWAEGTVDLVGSQPGLLAVHVECARGLDPVHMQVDFRWGTPLEVVTRIVPRIISDGRDPFTEPYPYRGFPGVSREGDTEGRRLTDDFLEDIAKEYLQLGRGYSQTLARRHNVSQRTVISWVQKARSRGILSPTRKGRAGGRLVPAAERPERVLGSASAS